MYEAAVPDNKRAERFPGSIKDKAVSWFSIKTREWQATTPPKIPSWADIKAALLSDFAEDISSLRVQLMNFKQNDLNVQDYTMAVLSLCSRVDTKMADKEKMIYSHQNLSEKYREKMLFMNSATPGQFLKNFKTHEASGAFRNSPPTVPPSA